MQIKDYIVLGAVALAVIGIIIYLCKKKKKGRGCGCGCSSCGKNCHTYINKTGENDKI